MWVGTRGDISSHLAVQVPTSQRINTALEATTDYAAKASDTPVLQKPLKQELDPSELADVFGFSRDLRLRCANLFKR